MPDMEIPILAQILRNRAQESKAWRMGSRDLPHGLASSMLDTERWLERAAKKLEEIK